MQTIAVNFAPTGTGALAAVSVAPGDMVGVQAVGAFVGTFELQGTVDGTNYVVVGMTPAAGGAVVTSFTAAGAWTANVAAYRSVRLNCTAFTSAPNPLTLAVGITGR